MGAGALNRGFRYNTPLQGDSAFRLGYSVSIEAYPLLRTPPGFYRRFGLGLSHEAQSGTAGHYDMATGSTVTYPVKQRRLGLDLRYFIPAGAHVLLVPAVGYGQVFSDLVRRTPAGVPSSCLLTNADPCFADLGADYLFLDLHIRIAPNPQLALTLVGGYLIGFGVRAGADQIATSEASATLQGFHADLGASFLIKNWFAVQATVPFRRYAYSLSPIGNTATYRGATDTYYGFLAGLAFLSP